MNLEKLIKTSIKNKKIVIGYEKIRKLLKTSSSLELIILAKNTPKNIKDELEYNAKIGKVEVKTYEGTGVELGNVCGKPFPISVIGILKR